MASDDSSDGPSDELEDKWDALIKIQKKQAVLGKLHNVQQISRNKKQWSDALYNRMFWISIIIGIIVYFGKSIYMSSEFHPMLKNWWSSSSNELSRYSRPKNEVFRYGRGAIRLPATEIPTASSSGAKLGVGLNQICTTSDYPAVASMMNLFLIWSNLSYKGALFIKSTIEFFEILNPVTRPLFDLSKETLTVTRQGYFNFLHYHGALTDYMDNMTDPLDLIYNADLRPENINSPTHNKDWIKNSWNESRKHGNIWFHMFPHNDNGTNMNEAGNELFDSGLFHEISRVDRNSNDAILIKFSNLMNGGLLNVAKKSTDQTETANDLVSEYFGTTAGTIAPDCTASAIDGALNGAIGVGMVAPGLVGLMPGPLIAALGIAGAAFGGISGYESSKETCCQNADPNNPKCGGQSLFDNIPGLN